MGKIRDQFKILTKQYEGDKVQNLIEVAEEEICVNDERRTVRSIPLRRSKFMRKR